MVQYRRYSIVVKAVNRENNIKDCVCPDGDHNFACGFVVSSGGKLFKEGHSVYLYFVCDDEPKPGQYYFDENMEVQLSIGYSEGKVIMASTDPKVIDSLLPDQDWLEQFCKSLTNDNKVEILSADHWVTVNHSMDVVWRPEPKNEKYLYIRHIKKSWTREEIYQILENYRVHAWTMGSSKHTLEEYIKKHL